MTGFEALLCHLCDFEGLAGSQVHIENDPFLLNILTHTGPHNRTWTQPGELYGVFKDRINKAA